MTKTRIEEVWVEISEAAHAKPILDGAFVLRRIDPAWRFDIFGGVDSSGNVMLAVGSAQTPPLVELESVSLDYFRQKRADGSWLMVLRLRQCNLLAVFGRVCQDLIEASSAVAGEDQLIRLFRERLNLWKRLFEQGGTGLLEDFKIKGLIAELLVLEEQLLARQPLEAVSSWVGPLRADQDFLFSDLAIEVKAIGPGTEGLSISSLQQLVANVPLSLRVITLRPASPAEQGAITLNSLAVRLEGSLAASPEALALFRGRLLEAGYVEDQHYDGIAFESLLTEDFEVTDSFPKLTPESVPVGISSAAYVVALEAVRSTG
jgi:hypothetical protein